MGADGGPGLGSKELDDLRAAVAGLEHDLGVVKGILYRTAPAAGAAPAVAAPWAPEPPGMAAPRPPYPPPGAPQGYAYPGYAYAPYQYATPPTPHPPRPPRPARSGAEAEASFAGTWSARIGVLAVLLGAAFAFKYGIDRGLIGPALRVVVGFVAGLGFVAWGWWAHRRTWERFAQAVTAGGIAICYLSILVGDLAYHLVTGPAALVILVGITVGNAALAWRYDSLALGIMATVGGFLDPLLAGSHRPAAATLYPYVAILDLGVLTFARRRGWELLPALARLGTWALFGVGFATAGVGLGLAYCGVFLVLFSAVPFVRAAAARRVEPADPADPADPAGPADPADPAGPARTGAVDAMLVGGHVLAAFALGQGLLAHTHHSAWAGAFTFALAAVLIGLGLLATALVRGDELLAGTLFGLGAAAAVIAAPMRFHHFALALTWGLEGLVFAAGGSGIRTRYCVRVGTLVSGAGGLVALSYLFHAYRPAHLLVSVPGASVLAIVGALAAQAWLSGWDQTGDGVDHRLWYPWTALAACGLAVAWLTAEAIAHFHAPDAHQAAWQPLQFSVSAIWGFSAAAMLGAGFAARLRWARLGALALLGVTIAKMLVVDLWTLSTGERVLGFIGLGAVLLACSLGYNRFKDLVLGTAPDPQVVAPAS